mgnify:CR=1 FL=1
MNTETILLGVIIALLAFIGWKEREGRLEKNKLINALLAKNATEMVNMDLADKTEIKTEKPKTDDLVPPENLNDEEWKEAVGLNG